MTTIFRGLIVGVMAFHVFVMFALARSMSRVTGFEWGPLVAVLFFALAMQLPLVWAVVLPDLPEIVRCARRRRRYAAGRCPVCDYPCSETGAQVIACPECGEPFETPSSFRFGWGTLGRFGVMIGLSWAIGCVGGLVWAVADERSFIREAHEHHAGGATVIYTRTRHWPGTGRLYEKDAGNGRIDATTEVP